jgi:hypothetical protein
MRLTEMMQKVCPIITVEGKPLRCQADACAGWETTHRRNGFRYGYCKLIDGKQTEVQGLNKKGVWVA